MLNNKIKENNRQVVEEVWQIISMVREGYWENINETKLSTQLIIWEVIIKVEAA